MFTEQVGSKIYDLRNSKFNLEIPTALTSMFRNSFAFTVAWIWNFPPEHVKELPSVSAFKKKVNAFNFASTTLV